MSRFYIIPQVVKEYGKTVPGWIQIKQVKINALQHTLTHFMGKGEASAIALTFDLHGTLVAPEKDTIG